MEDLKFCIGFSGLTIRFHFPTVVTLTPELTDLACDDSGNADEEFQIKLLTTPLPLNGNPVSTYLGTHVYPADKGWLRVYTPLTAENGCQVACLLCPDGKHKLYYPAQKWDFYAHPLHLLHLIGGEYILLRHNALLLHSSVVMIHGKMVLFSGASGVGKSTQASLWVKHLGAELINGDRCVVMEKEGAYWGGGSPWCGSSEVRRPDIAPIAGIFLVNQSSESKLEKLGWEAFMHLIAETTVNSWDPLFMQKVTDIYSGLLKRVPVYRLNCRPDREAVDLVYKTIFQKEYPHGSI